jgi:hypothetical protein
VKLVLVPCAARADTWWDNFDDGDFTIEPFWYHYVNGGCGATIDVTGDEHYVRFRRIQYVENGSYAYLYAELDQPVTRSTCISFDVNPVYSRVTGGAGPSDSQYPSRSSSVCSMPTVASCSSSSATSESRFPIASRASGSATRHSGSGTTSPRR